MLINVLIDTIARFAQQTRAHALVGAWALAEAVLLPVVPDVALLLLALAAPRRGLVLFVTLVAGSLVGTLLLWLIFSADPGMAHGLVMAVPGVRQAMLQEAQSAFALGDPTPFVVIGSGTPLKVLSLAWLETGGGLALPVWAVVNRLGRLGPALLVSAAIGWLAPDWLRRHDRLTLFAYAAFWVAVYALYLR